MNFPKPKGFQTKQKLTCPDCGIEMEEAERAVEGGSLYIWYECTDADCSGQWLSQKALKTEIPSQKEFMKGYNYENVQSTKM